jgi:hypothetical protein
MPERPSFEPSTKAVILERALRPGEPLSSPRPPHPNTSIPLIDDAVRVWLSSEFVDPSEYFRFDPPVALHRGAGWPLGVQLGRNSEERAAMSGMHDGYFDGDVARALTLPRRYTGLSFRPPPRRDMANLWIQHIGQWDGEPHRLAEIVAGLARLPKNRHPAHKYHALYALTPFSIIGQTWCERDPSEPAFIVDTTIAFFYTFETLIQECCITDAKRAGASTADIAAAYEHRYSNVRAQPNLLLNDPTTLRLARYANPSIDWESIRATPENSIGGSGLPGWEARMQREFLFVSRLETHLMVAVATACQGIANFASGNVRSALVRTTDVPPGPEALAPHWLGHMTGSYDHAAECTELLKGLACHYGQDLSSDLRGVPIPPFRAPNDAVEWSLVAARRHIDGCTTGDAFDAYRWNLFDASLDDASVIRWGRDAFKWVETGGWTDPPRPSFGKI